MEIYKRYYPNNILNDIERGIYRIISCILLGLRILMYVYIATGTEPC